MDRGAWQATVHSVAKVGDNLVTKPPPSYSQKSNFPLSRILKFEAERDQNPNFFKFSGFLFLPY